MRIDQKYSRRIITAGDQLLQHGIYKGRFTRTTATGRKSMSIRIDADQRAGRDTLPDLETSFEQGLRRRRCRHFLPDSAVQQARSFTQLQGSD